MPNEAPMYPKFDKNFVRLQDISIGDDLMGYQYDIKQKPKKINNERNRVHKS